MKLAPVILFTFNRPKHAEKTLKALAENELANETNLYIFSDGPRNDNDIPNVKSVREIINYFKNENKFLSVQICESKINKGLAKSVVSGVTKIFSKYNSVIVLEDDLITSVDFLKFMNSSLARYENDKTVGSLSGYNPLKKMPEDYKYDVYFTTRTCSLGWATWKKDWDDVDWTAKAYNKFKRSYKQRLSFNSTGFDRAKRLDRQMLKDAKSWSILFGFDIFIKKKNTLYASNSKLIHIGWDGTGTHSSDNNVQKFNDKTEISEYPLNFPKEIVLENRLMKLQRELFGADLKVKIKDFIVYIKNFIK
jgi:hypothetical protein